MAVFIIPVELCRQGFGNLARFQLQHFGQFHSGIALVVAEFFLGALDYFKGDFFIFKLWIGCQNCVAELIAQKIYNFLYRDGGLRDK